MKQHVCVTALILVLGVAYPIVCVAEEGHTAQQEQAERRSQTSQSLFKKFRHWRIVYHYFQMWSKDGTWKRIHDEMRRKVRKKQGKEPEPTAGIIDSQSVKTTEKRGFADMMRGRK